jgi:hypothetical protein
MEGEPESHLTQRREYFFAVPHLYESGGISMSWRQLQTLIAVSTLRTTTSQGKIHSANRLETSYGTLASFRHCPSTLGALVLRPPKSRISPQENVRH